MAATSEGDQNGIQAAGAAVTAFHRWDKGSIAFRYASTKAGEPVTFPLDTIDLVKLRETMKAFENFLLSVEGHLHSLSEQEPC